MRYVNAMSMVLSLIGTFILIQLGFEYQYGSGHGLHPVLAGLGVVLLLAAGYTAACFIQDQDE